MFFLGALPLLWARAQGRGLPLPLFLRGLYRFLHVHMSEFLLVHPHPPPLQLAPTPRERVVSGGRPLAAAREHGSGLPDRRLPCPSRPPGAVAALRVHAPNALPLASGRHMVLSHGAAADVGRARPLPARTGAAVGPPWLLDVQLQSEAAAHPLPRAATRVTTGHATHGGRRAVGEQGGGGARTPGAPRTGRTQHRRLGAGHTTRRALLRRCR